MRCSNLAEPIKLGGNIELVGFDSVDGAEMVVVKKMVGSYAKDMSEKNSNFKSLTVSMDKDGDQFRISSSLQADNDYKAEESGANLFMTMDKSLKKIISQL